MMRSLLVALILAIVLASSAASVASATILGPTALFYPTDSMYPFARSGHAWQGLEGICHLQPDSVLPEGGLTAVNYNGLGYMKPTWSCLTHGVQVTQVSVGSTVDFRKLSVEGRGPTESYSRTLARVRWDVGDDGVVEKDDAGPWPTGEGNAIWPQYVRGQLIEFSYAFKQVGDIALRVTADYDDGTSETTTGVIPVVPIDPNATPDTPPPGEQGISINHGDQFTNDPDVMVSLVWPAGRTQVRLSNDGGFGNTKLVQIHPEVPWRLQSSGPERLPKTVYARFDGSPIITTFQDDIILDETPPTVSQASLTGASTRSAARAAVVAKTRTYKLKIKASDKTSGVAGMQITSDKRKPGKVLRYSTKATYKTTKSSVYVRAKDRAGNVSKWRTPRK